MPDIFLVLLTSISTKEAVLNFCLFSIPEHQQSALASEEGSTAVQQKPASELCVSSGQ